MSEYIQLCTWEVDRKSLLKLHCMWLIFISSNLISSLYFQKVYRKVSIKIMLYIIHFPFHPVNFFILLADLRFNLTVSTLRQLAWVRFFDCWFCFVSDLEVSVRIMEMTILAGHCNSQLFPLIIRVTDWYRLWLYSSCHCFLMELR